MNWRISPIGFAIALVLLPAYRSPTARGLVARFCTMSEPESPEFRNLLLLLAITICPVNVLVNEAPPAHSFS